jgi:hypothetical protein
MGLPRESRVYIAQKRREKIRAKGLALQLKKCIDDRFTYTGSVSVKVQAQYAPKVSRQVLKRRMVTIHDTALICNGERV